MWKQFVGEFSGCKVGCKCSPGCVPRGKKESLQGLLVGKNTSKRDVSSWELLQPEEFLREWGKIPTKGCLGPGKVPEGVGWAVNHPGSLAGARIGNWGRQSPTGPSQLCCNSLQYYRHPGGSTEIKLPRSWPETGAKSARLLPSACEWTAEAMNGSLFCFNYGSIVRETRKRGGTRGITLRARVQPRWFVLWRLTSA